MPYLAADDRYASTRYRRAGRSGLLLPPVSLGLWHNFGGADRYETGRAVVRRAFDLGVTHFDLANNYGPPPGSAEETFGRIVRDDLRPYRDEIVVSTKAGWPMWPGPYGDGGSRKSLLASLDQSLKRMELDYVDVFYHHRPDPDTPLEESLGALAEAVRSGRARYAGISAYPPDLTRRAAALLREMGTPCVLHQPRYSLLDRWPEHGLFDALEAEGIGCVVFSPLEQGLLTDRYLGGIPADSRAAQHRGNGAMEENAVTDERVTQARRVNEIARGRGQSLAQLALAWVLRRPVVTSAIVGASRPEQLAANVAALAAPPLHDDELRAIDAALVP